MSQKLYKVINPIVKRILCSPLHGLMSKNTLLLEFKGRKSGRTLSTPVSYHLESDRIHCFTSKGYRWWRNLVDNPDVTIQLKGQARRGRARVSVDDPDRIASALRAFLIAVPRDAPHAGVGLDQDGQPIARDVTESAKKMVYVCIELGGRPEFRPKS